MAIQEVTFPSSNGRDTIYGWIYEPTQPARGVVQIVHGLGEHSRRYLHMITALLDAGFVVAADDHAGHGKTSTESGVWGDTGENGVTTVISDEYSLHKLVRDDHPDLPFFMFGHSWGSMIARGFASAHGATLSGLALCGVAAQIDGVETKLDRVGLDAALAAGPGTASGEEFVGQIFEDFVSRYTDVRTPNDWIALDPDVVADHARDPFNNYYKPMSLRFVHDFVTLYDQVNAPDWYTSIRADLPVLVLAGDQDPVANYGEGAYHVANQLEASGHRDVRTHVYTGYRHEVHNEPQTRADVESELTVCIDGHLQ
ncbi:MAG: lysophospholipase [Propionibacterium sp.]|nr:lysophospholipase [Propionibacterium sp.]